MSVGISFSIKKKEGPLVGEKSDPLIKRQEDDKERKDFVLSLEGKEIHSTIPKVEKKELIIPMIGKNNWRIPSSQTKRSDGTEEVSGEQLSVGAGASGKSSEELELDKEAAAAVLRDLQEARVAATEKESELVVPLLLSNKPPVMEGREKDDLADIELRPNQSTLDEYETVPIESFGAGMLRGMGWKKGTAIGRSNKGLIEPIEFIPRVGGLGLGATPRVPPPDPRRRIKKPGEEEKKTQGPFVGKDGRVKYYKKVGEEIPDQPLQGFVVGNYARVVKGPHRNLTGKIVSVDEDTARVVLRMAINNQTLSFSQHHLELVGREEYHKRPTDAPSSNREDTGPSSSSQDKQYGLVTKRDRSSNQREPPSKRTKYNTDDRSSQDNSKQAHSRHSKQESRSSDWGRTHHEASASSQLSDRSSKSHRGQGPYTRDTRDQYQSMEQQQSVSRGRSWLYPHLRVRMIDQKYKKGKYYNTKVMILDVISLGECVCQTESGKLLEGVTEAMLETVIPRSSGSKVMIVGGANKGKIATIIEQDRHKARAVVEISLSKEVLQVDFDDICEFIGHTDDD